MKDTFSQAPMPSFVWLPISDSYETVYDFLIEKFPRVSAEIWRQRIIDQKVSFENGGAISLETPYCHSTRIRYFREVINEPTIPFEEKILFENDHFLIVDKPHFLPIHPAGKFVNQTLISRLKSHYPEIATAHRIDRLTAGLVLCTKQKSVRAAYQQMFMNRQVEKKYVALGKIPDTKVQKWHIKNHLEPHLSHFRMQIATNKAPNSESYIELIERYCDHGKFRLKPISGKKHQLRVHMTAIGSAILHDPLYPTFPETPVEDNYQKPLQLLAHELSFTDPFSLKKMTFHSHLTLDGIV